MIDLSLIPKSRLEQMEAHMDEGGKFTHENAVELLQHIRQHGAEFGNAEWCGTKESEKYINEALSRPDLSLIDKLNAIRNDWLADGQEQKVFAMDYIFPIIRQHEAVMRDACSDKLRSGSSESASLANTSEMTVIPHEPKGTAKCPSVFSSEIPVVENDTMLRLENALTMALINAEPFTSEEVLRVAIAHFRGELPIDRPSTTESVSICPTCKGKNSQWCSDGYHDYGSVASALDSSPASDVASASRDDNPNSPAQQADVNDKDVVDIEKHEENYGSNTQQPVEKPVYKGRDHMLHLTQKAKNFLANAPKRESGWQPIETAPKDRTNILVFWPDEIHCPVTAHYSTGKWSDGIGWKFTGWGQEKKTIPTHWMPLPPNPTGIEGDKP